jgi:hypothetical protein
VAVWFLKGTKRVAAVCRDTPGFWKKERCTPIGRARGVLVFIETNGGRVFQPAVLGVNEAETLHAWLAPCHFTDWTPLGPWLSI